MIIYYPDAQALIDKLEFREMLQIKLPSGGFVNAEALTANRLRIVEVVSTDPMDFMIDKYQPGMVLELNVDI